MKLTLIFINTLFIIQLCDARLLFVSTTGSDLNPGTIDKPFKSLNYITCGGKYGCPEKRKQHLKSNDTIYIRGGIYKSNNWNIITDDTSIVILPYNDELVIIEGDYTKPLLTLGEFSKISNLKIAKIKFRKGIQSGIKIGQNYLCKNITIDSCKIEDIKIHDNTGCVYLGTNWDNVVITNCTLSINQEDKRIGCGIQLFRGSNNALISNNYIHSSARGIYYKHASSNMQNTLIIENNKFDNIAKISVALSANNVLIQNNLFLGSKGVAIYYEEAGSCDVVGAFNNQIIHNTFINSTLHIGNPSKVCPLNGARNTKVRNNLFYNPQEDIMFVWQYLAHQDTSGPNVDSDYNLFYSTIVRPFTWVSGRKYNFTDYQMISKQDKHSIQSEPLFVDTLKQNYKLKDSSPGKSILANGKDVGVLY